MVGFTSRHLRGRGIGKDIEMVGAHQAPGALDDRVAEVYPLLSCDGVEHRLGHIILEQTKD